MEDTGTQQPGQTITPTQPASAGTSPSPPPPAQVPEPAPPAPPEPAAPAPAPTPEKQSPAPEVPPAAAPEPVQPPPQSETPDTPVATASPEEAAPSDEPDEEDEPNGPPKQPITWTASEFIAHAKSFGWYATLAAAALIITAAVFFITKGDIISMGVVIVGAMLLGIYGGHRPRQLEYRIDVQGLSIGQKHFGYHEFRSFSILPENAFSSIVFMPLRRFAAPTTIYYAPEDEDKIVGLLAGHLPLEDGKHDLIDRLMQRIRF